MRSLFAIVWITTVFSIVCVRSVYIQYTDGSQNICFYDFYGCNIKLEKALVVFCHFLRDGEKASISLTHHACVISSTVFSDETYEIHYCCVCFQNLLSKISRWAPVDPDSLVKKGDEKTTRFLIRDYFMAAMIIRILSFSPSRRTHGFMYTWFFWDSNSRPFQCVLRYSTPQWEQGGGIFPKEIFGFCLFKGNLEDHPMTCKWIITMVIVSPLRIGLWDPFQMA